MGEMKIENWYGYDIRFINIDGEWWAILKDICDALNLRTDKVAYRLSPDMLEKVMVETTTSIPNTYKNHDHPSRVSIFSKNVSMTVINEKGIYQALFASRRLEARKFQMWTFDVLKKLRQRVGLQQYEVMQMTDPKVQEEIDWILDSLYWDDEKKCVMQSVTVQGGDVIQKEFI